MTGYEQDPNPWIVFAVFVGSAAVVIGILVGLHAAITG